MPRIRLGHIEINLYTDVETLLNAFDERIQKKEPSQIVTLNSIMFRKALEIPSLARVISDAAFVTADSTGIKWAVGVLAGTQTRRIAGIDLIDTICARAEKRKYGIFFLGSKENVAEMAGRNLKAKYPALEVKGTQHGYFNKEESARIAETVRKSGADVLLVGLNVPEQEIWISDNLKNLGAPVVMGVGGSFDVISGRLERAPAFLRMIGLEWLFRFAQQPWRILRLLDLPKFVFAVLYLFAARGKRARSG
ncbi:MAG: WecB/TagA/CpsF family glycosyltransferase [Endomicrobiales bacterium]|nr:WecB/TagA/CpsF family glycosyltransferase [Endomicrobiales bacterium]